MERLSQGPECRVLKLPNMRGHFAQPLEHHPPQGRWVAHSVQCPLVTGITLYPNPSHCSHCPDPDRHPLWLDRDLYRDEPVLVDETAARNTWNISPDLVSMLSWLHSWCVSFLSTKWDRAWPSFWGGGEQGPDDCSLMVGDDWDYYCLLSKTTISLTPNHIVHHSCRPGDSWKHNSFPLYPWLTSANPIVTAQGWCLVASPVGLIFTAWSRIYTLITDFATVPTSSARLGG